MLSTCEVLSFVHLSVQGNGGGRKGGGRKRGGRKGVGLTTLELEMSNIKLFVT